MIGNLNSGTTLALPRITPGNEAGGPLTIDVCSQLTKAFEGGMVLDPGRKMVLVPDEDGDPILFSIGTSGQMHATRRDRTTRNGWLRRDVVPAPARDGADGAMVVDAFAVNWHSGGLAAAVAMRPGGRNGGPSLLCWTPHLDGDGASSQWFVVDPPTSEPIHFVELGNGHSGGPDLLVASSANEALGQMHRLLLSTDEDPKVLPFVVPHDWSRVLSCTMGTSDIGDGAYVLYEHGAGRGVAFITFVEKKGRVPRTRLITTGSVPACLAVTTEETGLSSLYIGSDQGLHVLSADEQGQSVTVADPVDLGVRGTQLMPADATITDLATAQDENGHPSVYARTSTKELRHTAYDGQRWNGLTVMRHGVEAIAAAREHGPLLQHFFAASEDPRDHAYFWQSESSLWQHDRVTLPDDGTCHDTHRYLTRVALRNADDSPADSREVSISAEDGAQLEINERTLFLRPGEQISAKSDVKGVLSVAVRASGIATPRVTLTIKGTAQTLTIDPTAHVTRILAKVDGGTLHGLTDRAGQPLLKGRFASPEGAANAATLLRTLGQETDFLAFRDPTTNGGAPSLAEHGIYLATPGAVAARPRRPEDGSLAQRAIALDLTGAQARMLHGPDATDATEQRREANAQIQPLSDVFGNLIQTIKESFAGKTLWAYLEPLGQGFKFIIETIDGIVDFVVKTAKQALHAVDAVMKSVLGFGIEDVVHWLGVVFDPTAIGKVYDALQKNTVESLQQMRGGLGQAKAEVDKYIGGMREQWRQLEKLSDEQRGIGLKAAAKQAKEQESHHANEPAAALSRNPVMSWGASQLIPESSPDAIAIFKPALELMDGVLRTFQRIADESLVPLGKSWKDTVDHAIRRLQDAAKADKLTVGYLIEVLGEGLVEAVLADGQAIADALLVAADELLATLQRVLFETRFPVPLLCPLFENVLMPGHKFTIATALLIGPAVAISTLGRALTGRTPLVDRPVDADGANDDWRVDSGLWGAGVAGLVLTVTTDLSNVIRSRYSVAADTSQIPATLEAGMQLFEVVGRALVIAAAFPANSYFAPPAEGAAPIERIGNWVMWGYSVMDLLFDTAIMSFKALTGRKEISIWVTGVKAGVQLVVNVVGIAGLLIYRVVSKGHPYLLVSLAGEGAVGMIGQLLIDFGTELPVEPGSPEQMAAQAGTKSGLITAGGVVIGAARFLTVIRLLVCTSIYIADREEYKKTFYWTFW